MPNRLYIRLSAVFLCFVLSGRYVSSDGLTNNNSSSIGGTVSFDSRFVMISSIGQPITGSSNNEKLSQCAGFCFQFSHYFNPIEVRDISPADDYYLFGNYPNPFNPTTTIKYQVPDNCHVELAVFDILGRKISVLHDGMSPAGMHEITWNGRNDHGSAAGSGIYILMLKTDRYIHKSKMTLLK